jgi:4-amino-4-deoxy-L-arabinose transferase-like glycosyltransferase
MNELTKSKTFLWSLFAVFCVLWLYALGARTLVPTDEGRYAEMAREMVATGDWITPRLNAIKYFEKPPLQIWMTALAFKAFGLGEWQARLWTGLCGLLGVVLTWQAGRRLFDEQTGLTAALVLGSCFWWAGMGHINTLDMGLAGMMSLTLCGLLLGQNPAASPAERRRWMLLCWVGMALAVLSKSLIGVMLPGAVLVLYTLASRDWAIWKRLHMGLGLLVFFAITVPWHVLVSIKNPEFAQFFFVHEQFQRFTSKVHHREGPWYYFIPLLIIGVLPWLTVLGQSVWQGWRSGSSSGTGTGNRGFQPGKMLVIWAVFIFVFFSISGSKLPSYILPIFPALALLMALCLQRAGRLTWAFAASLSLLLGVAGVVAMTRLPGLAKNPAELAQYKAAVNPGLAASVLMIVAGALVLLWIRQKRPDLQLRATLALAIGGFLAGQLAILATEDYGRYRSGLPLVPAIQAELTPGVPLYSVGMYDQTLPFYLRRTMTLVEHADELEFGLQQEPQLWFPTLDGFIVQWANGKKAVAITRPEVYADLQKRGVPMRLITSDARRIVIANDPK